MENGRVLLYAACAVAHTATVPLLTCVVSTDDDGYLADQSLAMIFMGGCACGLAMWVTCRWSVR